MKIENLQQLFEICVKGIVKQGSRCVGEYGACFYRCDDQKCIIGQAIPDSVYSPKIENHSIDRLLEGEVTKPLPRKFTQWVEANPVFSSENIAAITALQSIHDSGKVIWEQSEARLVECFKNYAESYGLNSEFIDDLDFSAFKFSNDN